jgi:hypothetical protein
MNASEFIPALSGVFGANMTQRFAPLYPLSTFSSPWWALVQVMTDSLLLCPTQHTASTLTGGGIYSQRTSPVYVYYFVHEFEMTKMLIDPFRPMGVFHCVYINMQ